MTAYKPAGATFPLDFGIIVDRPGYHPDLTAIDNLKRLAVIRGIVGEAEIIAALEAVGLDPRTKQKARNFSLGMKQKLALAQAIMAVSCNGMWRCFGSDQWPMRSASRAASTISGVRASRLFTV